MKKNVSKIIKLYSLILTLFTAFVLSSCDGVIFYEIRNEVKLSDSEIGGTIQNVVRYSNGGTESVFIANGSIKYRSVEDDVVGSKISWSTFSAPSSDYVYSIAADSSNLYAMTVTIDEDDDGYNSATTRTLYCWNGSSWTAIASKAYSDTYAFLMCTNGVDSSARKAYLRYGSYVYSLNGANAVDLDTPSYLYASDANSLVSSSAPTTTEDDSRTRLLPFSCTSFKGTTYFSSGYAMTSNSDYVYFSNGDVVYYSTDGSTWSSVDLSCDSEIRSMAVTSDYLLAGTDDGIVHTPLSSGVPSSGNADFSTNAASTLSSYYEVLALLAINPDATETGGTIYASCITSSSSASHKNEGLWSYYASTGEWNRE